MAEASSRILLDRNVIRLDGRPFYSFGPRVLLTPAERFPEVLREIAGAGFTVVGSPPCSPGTTKLLIHFFEAAEAAGLMVVLMPDPRLPDHGRYMADFFASRPSLHSYVLPARAANDESLNAYKRERDGLRAHDLFHPIWTPLDEEQHTANWFSAQDVYCPVTARRVPGGRLTHQRAGGRVARLAKASRNATPRPFFCSDLRVFTSDEERQLGIYADDPQVARYPAKPLDWFPYLAGFSSLSRRDMLGPDPELLRLQVYELLSQATRGILLEFYEAMGGVSPMSGRDRWHEATILAQEIALMEDFFAEGKPEFVELETGHPKLGAAVIRHGHDLLLVLRMEGYEEDYFIDEGYMERTEISLILPNAPVINAWRMDFPAPRQLEVVREANGAIRFLAGPLELTGLIMLTPGSQRSQDVAAKLIKRLPLVANAAVESLTVRLAKIELIEGELQAMNAGVNNRERIVLAQKGLMEARGFLATDDFVDAYNKARQTARLLRQVVKYQMAKALATAVMETSGIRQHLRSNYFTLPSFYRQSTSEAARAFSDLT